VIICVADAQAGSSFVKDIPSFWEMSKSLVITEVISGFVLLGLVCVSPNRSSGEITVGKYISVGVCIAGLNGLTQMFYDSNLSNDPLIGKQLFWILYFCIWLVGLIIFLFHKYKHG
jgi:hypothetical protein